MSEMIEMIEKLEQRQPATPTKWKEKAEVRIENKRWLRYSQYVAMQMLNKMEAIGLNQRGLAERMGCSQQYISKILKGQENLSIETICKIEEALELELLQRG
jgi:antitoxin component HigA of HigAB toxin-antitoxin module